MLEGTKTLFFLQESKKDIEKRPLLSAQLHYGYKPIMSCYNFVFHYVERDSTENIEGDARICIEC